MLISSLQLLEYRLRKWVRNTLAASSIAIYRSLGDTSVGSSSGTLSVTDNRTKRNYTINIEHNSIKAIEFRQITAAGRGTDAADQGGCTLVMNNNLQLSLTKSF